MTHVTNILIICYMDPGSITSLEGLGIIASLTLPSINTTQYHVAAMMLAGVIFLCCSIILLLYLPERKRGHRVYGRNTSKVAY
jgi:hypothetical protein